MYQIPEGVHDYEYKRREVSVSDTEGVQDYEYKRREVGVLDTRRGSGL